MNKQLFLYIVFLCFPIFVTAQICKGKVLDAESGQPIPNANVFLEGSMIGSSSDKAGFFEFDTEGHQALPLVVSVVGYETVMTNTAYFENNFALGLKKKNFEIDEVDVKSNPSAWSRSKMLSVFKKEFLGGSYNARACKIENDEVLYLFYNDKTNTLHAHSRGPLLIRNRLLGYNVSYQLETFRKKGISVFYKGYCSFEEIPNRNKRQMNGIIEQRSETFMGSRMHFLRNLYHENYMDADTIFDEDVIASLYFWNDGQAGSLPRDVELDLSLTARLSKNEINNTLIKKYQTKFQLYDTLGNFIPLREIVIDTLGERYLYSDQVLKIKYLGNLSTSYVIPKKKAIKLFENGYFDPESMTWLGHMSRYRIGDMMPFDYKYVPPVKKKKNRSK